MTVLLVQTFLLLLGAFLLGASLACFLRRAFSGGDDDSSVLLPSSPGLTSTAVATGPIGAGYESDRFGRALAGGDGVSVPPVFQGSSTGPVVEVQPPPVARVAEPEPLPAPAPVAPPPVTAAPPPPPAVSEPVPPANPAPVEKPVRENAFKPVTGPSYTEIAVVAAAAAAAAAAKAKAEQEEADRLAAEQSAAEADAASASEGDGAPYEFAGDGDDLTRIHSIDAELKDRLYRFGVGKFAAIAAWTPDDVRSISQTLGFQGRIERENWVEQAQILSRGSGIRNDTREVAAPQDIAVPLGAERLHRIIGIDPASEAKLYERGITRVADIAAWTTTAASAFEGLLGLEQGRIAREGWVEQARYLTRAEHGEADTVSAELPKAVDAPVPPRTVTQSSIVTISERPSAPADGGQGRDHLTGLRSVKSEALRGATSVATGSGSVDDLKRIRGIGVLIEKKLNSLGITGYEQVANWTDADIDRISQLLDFKGRIERENWIEQARILASGGQTEFSRRVDRGEA